MKTLKFKPNLCKMILAGKKSATWRLFDDKDLQVGDKIEFINHETSEAFGTGEITNLRVKTLGTLEEQDWEGHEKFSSDEEMYATYRSYYGDIIGPDSELKIVDFTFKKLLPRQ